MHICNCWLRLLQQVSDITCKTMLRFLNHQLFNCYLCAVLGFLLMDTCTKNEVKQKSYLRNNVNSKLSFQFLSQWSSLVSSPYLVHHGEKSQKQPRIISNYQMANQPNFYGITNLEMEKKRFLEVDMDPTSLMCVNPHEVTSPKPAAGTSEVKPFLIILF